MPERTDREIVFDFDIGIDTYQPSITSERLFLSQLSNISPRNNRLVTVEGVTTIQTLAGNLPIRSFPWYLNVSTNETRLYATTKDKVFYLDNSSENFVEITGIDFGVMDTPVSWVPWFDRVFITRLGQPLAYLRGSEFVTVDSSWQPNSGNTSARYIIDADNHLFMANLIEGINPALTRVRWSDLQDPENFTVSRGTEADFFDLETSDTEITGLSKQRGYIIIYTRNSIWRANYEGLPTIFNLTPVLNGVGNIFHYGVVREKQLDFFVGQDNFYMLDGFRLIPIGDPIWRFFEDELQGDFEFNDYMYSYLDEQNMECVWTYLRSDDSIHAVVYNYRENKWSDRGINNLTAAHISKNKPKVSSFIDDQTRNFRRFLLVG